MKELIKLIENLIKKIEYLINLVLEVKSLLQASKETIVPIGDYISEQEAQKLLDKGTTWFWNARQKGILTFTKMGNTNYYYLPDIIAYLEKNRRDKFR